jgi:hypothetical protein
MGLAACVQQPLRYSFGLPAQLAVGVLLSRARLTLQFDGDSVGEALGSSEEQVVEVGHELGFSSRIPCN